MTRVILSVLGTFVLSVAALGQEISLPGIEEVVMGCRDHPSSGLAISITIADAWVQRNALFADLVIRNQSHSSVRLPRRNVYGHYWAAELFNGKGEPIEYCGGVSAMQTHPQREIITDKDIVSVAANGTITLRGVYLAPFWPYLWSQENDVSSFEVIYNGWCSVTVLVETATLDEKSRSAIAQASERHCSLYGGEITSRKYPFKPHRRPNSR